MSRQTAATPTGNADECRTEGFGWRPSAAPHHFAVLIGRHGVAVVERFAPPDAPEAGEPVTKAALSPYLWERVRGAAAADFNRRLQAAGLRPGAWRGREVPLAPHFGKELALLAWVVEDQDADPTPVPAMIANWQGLAPEERWWFYTTVNAAGEAARDRGWRQAVKVAFRENPTHLPPTALTVPPAPPGGRARAEGEGRLAAHGDQLGLWGAESKS